ncbi:hypothetical protein AHAS_Ahas02G0097400 [Arachis hypogaea]
MGFTSSFSQINFMGYCPPSQYDSSQYSNYGWEYHQEDTNFEHSNPWRFASEPQDEQENYEGYQPPPQNDSYHYPHGGWEYHQETANSEQSNHMKNYSPSRPNFSFESSSSLDYASTQNEDYLQAIEIHRKLVEKYTQPQSWKEIILKKMNEPLEQTRRNLEPSNKEDEDQFVGEEVEKQDEEASVSSEILVKKEEVVEVFGHEPRILHSQEPLEVTMKHKDSLPEALKENHEEEREEDIQEKSHSTEVEKCKEEKHMEPPMQEALDEEITPTITQQPSLEFKEVKATNKSTNPVLDPASKIKQAICKRKLAEERPMQGTKAETSPPLKSFLLTNWKKRKKVKNNMSS